MSSYIVNDLTINRIITYLYDNCLLENNLKLRSKLERLGILAFDEETSKQKAGYKLLELNHEAVRQRYDGKLSEEENDLVKNYRYVSAPCNLYQAYKHLCCLTYQMSEGNVPKTKLYKALEELETIIGLAIAWEVTEEKGCEWEAKEEQSKIPKEKVLEIVRERDKEMMNIHIDEIYQQLTYDPKQIDEAIKQLLEEGQIYEPKPGMLRYLG